MRRKLIRQGGGAGLTLYVPKKWIDEQKLKPGDEIEISEEEANLVLSVPAEVRAPEAAVEINVSQYGERTIRNILNQAYRKGFDKIVLQCATSEQSRIISKITRETLLGFEVTEDKQRRCVVQNVAEPAFEKYDILLRKIFLLTKQEAEEIANELQTGFFDAAKRQESKDAVDKYTNFVRRTIIKNKVGGNRNSYLLFYLVSQLSIIHHAYHYLEKHAAFSGKKVSEPVRAVFGKCNALFNDLYESFYTKDISRAHNIQEQKEKLLVQIHRLLMKKSGAENVILYHCGELCRVIQLAGTVIFGFIAEY